MQKRVHAMLVIPEPAPNSRIVFIAPPEGPVMRGEGEGAGPVSYACGGCGRILIESLFDGQVRNLVIRCTSCASFNEAAPANEFN